MFGKKNRNFKKVYELRELINDEIMETRILCPKCIRTSDEGSTNCRFCGFNFKSTEPDIISCDKCKHLIYKKDAVLLEGIFTCPNCCENKNWTAVYCNITGCNEPKKPKSKPKKGKK